MTLQEYCATVEEFVSRQNAHFAAFVKEIVYSRTISEEDIVLAIRERVEEDDMAAGEFFDVLLKPEEPVRLRRVLQI